MHCRKFSKIMKNHVKDLKKAKRITIKNFVRFTDFTETMVILPVKLFGNYHENDLRKTPNSVNMSLIIIS